MIDCKILTTLSDIVKVIIFRYPLWGIVKDVNKL